MFPRQNFTMDEDDNRISHLFICHVCFLILYLSDLTQSKVDYRGKNYEEQAVSYARVCSRFGASFGRVGGQRAALPAFPTVPLGTGRDCFRIIRRSSTPGRK